MLTNSSTCRGSGIAKGGLCILGPPGSMLRASLLCDGFVSLLDQKADTGEA